MEMQLRDALEDAPFKSYTKTINGGVFIYVWNSTTNKEETRVLVGKPKTAGAVINVYSPQEDLYFKRKNNRHFVKGNLLEIPFTAPAVAVDSFEQSTDEELTALLNKPYKALEHAMNKTQSVAVLNRILTLAEELGKAEGTMKHIRTRIAEVQGFSEE